MKFKSILLIALVLYSASSFSQEMNNELFRIISLAIIEQNENEIIRQKLDSVTIIYEPVSGETSFQIDGKDSIIKARLIESISVAKAIDVLDNESLIIKPQDKTFYVVDSLNIFCKSQKENIQGYKFKTVKKANSTYFINIISICINSKSVVVTCSFSHSNRKLTIHAENFENKMDIKRLSVK